MNISSVLYNAKAFIDTPEKWTKHQLAKDSNGESSDIMSKDTVCFCSSGAVFRALDDDHRKGATYNLAFDYLNRVVRELDLDVVYIEQYNDLPTTSHSDIMAVWDYAIMKAINDEAKNK